MRRALCLLHDDPASRRRCFIAGLRAAGYRMVDGLPDPQPEDAVLIWNRKDRTEPIVARVEAAGGRVFVAENGYLGKGWIGGRWYALAVGHHSGAGRWPDLGAQRWDGFGVAPDAWREGGTETVILGQRGIGETGIKSPKYWAEVIRRRIGGRIRPHPGRDRPGVPLREDLQHAACAVTWASSAGLLALLHGVPVFYDMPKWIGAGAARPVAQFHLGPLRDDTARLAMFRRLAWAMWRIEEIQSGQAFAAYD